MASVRKWISTVPCVMGLLSGGSASAQTLPEDPNTLVGSDGMNQLMDLLAPNILARAPEGIVTYQGLGARAGQRQMEGATQSGDPACDWAGVGDNPGCQELAPMAMLLDSAVCDDQEAAGEAESLLIGLDAIVLLASNDAREQYSVGSCPASSEQATPNPGGAFSDTGLGHLRGSGTLAASGYLVGENLAEEDAWQDVLRLLYTGCDNSEGSCSATVERTQRCNNPARQELLSDWGALLEGQACGTTVCEGVRHLFRRDDDSGIATQFLAKIGVEGNGLVSRRTVLNGGGFPAQIGEAPEDFPFCDGGADEQYAASSNGSDPARVPCAPSADLCGADGLSGTVQAIRSVEGFRYPTQQCGRNLFARVPWAITEQAVCPDGTAPVGGLCNLPYRLVDGERDFDCINSANSRPSTLPGVDGRVYNFVERDASGRVVFLGNGYPLMASYRQDMVEMDTGFGAVAGKDYEPGEVVCQQPDATRTIACLVASDPCSMGLSGRASATAPAFAPSQEPLVLSGVLPTSEDVSSDRYPLSSGLYLGAIGGFEALNADCEARGHRAIAGADDYCFAQYETAIAAYTMPPSLQGAIEGLGYVAIAPDRQHRCVGAQQSAGCGAPETQPLTACFPPRPVDRSPSPAKGQ